MEAERQRKPNGWIQFVKDYAQKKNLSYGCAISKPECKAAYQQKKKPVIAAEEKEEPLVLKKLKINNDVYVIKLSDRDNESKRMINVYDYNLAMSKDRLKIKGMYNKDTNEIIK